MTESACILWPGKRDSGGYGTVRCGEIFRAHRLMYTLFKGPIPPGMMVLHSCDNPPCCNPEHLRVGTALDNAEDAISRGRSAHQKKYLAFECSNIVRNTRPELVVGHIRLISEGMTPKEALEEFDIAPRTHRLICELLKFRPDLAGLQP